MTRWLAVFLLLTSATMAEAQSRFDAARQWGLIGNWADDCSQPPSRDNLYYAFVERNGALFLERDYGGAKQDNEDRNPITAVSVRPDDMIALTIDFPRFKEARVNVYAKSSDGSKLRIMHNHSPDGSNASVRDGRLVSLNRETTWMTRCASSERSDRR